MKKNIGWLILLVGIKSSLHAQTLQGTVQSVDTHTPIRQASVSIPDLGIEVLTDSLGVFRFYNSLPKEFTLKVTAKNYETFTKTILVGEKTVIELNSKHIELDEVTVSGARNLLQKYNAVYISTRKLSDLNGIASTSLGEALSSIPGVYQATAGLGISKPVVRGMQGIRVVSILNGLRIENQQWGGDHGMGITELGIGTVEVIKGPASLLYGADALGGVIYFSDEGYARQQEMQLGVKTTFEMNTLGTSNQLSYKIAGNNVRLNVAGSFTSHADYQLPNKSFVANSRFSEQGLKLAFGANRNNWNVNVRYNFSSNRVGIPGETEDSVLIAQHFQVQTQERKTTTPSQFFQNHFLSVENKWLLKRAEISVLLGQTLNKLTEFESSFSTPGIDMALANSLYAARLRYSFSDRLSLVGGIQGMFQQNNNLPTAEEKLIPSSKTMDNGAYSIAYLQLGKWNLQGGLRVDFRQINAEKTLNQLNFSKGYQNTNFSIGAVRSVKKSTYRIAISSGFRAPHLSELLANGFHHGASRYEIGNSELLPEKAIQLDLSYEMHREHVELVFNPFYNYIQNYISAQPIDSIINNFPVFAYQQLPFVHLIGMDIGAHYHPHFAHWLHLESSISLIQAQQQNSENVALMPQNRFTTTAKVTFNGKKMITVEELIVQYALFAPQQRVALNETPSPYYQLAHAAIHLKIRWKNPLFVAIGVKNIFNERYIDHLSRLKNSNIDQQGRNIYFSLKYYFTHSKSH